MDGGGPEGATVPSGRAGGEGELIAIMASGWGMERESGKYLFCKMGMVDPGLRVEFSLWDHLLVKRP